MKNTINISISGIAFTLESDAYDALNNYMKQIEGAYSSDSASSEIIGDIEARISELVLSWQSEHTTIVTKECIDSIIAQLGVPEEPSASQTQHNTTFTDNERPIINKRLYRNGQGSRIGGVLNGLATYFNIDVTMLRIVVVAIFIACLFIGHHQATTLPIIFIGYIGMWMIVPLAKNAREKMEMQGQPITAETISTNIKESLDSISPSEKNEKTASIFTNLIYAIGRIIRFIFMMIASVVGIAVIGVFIAIIAAGCAIIFEGQDSIRLFIDTDPTWVTILATLSAIVPLTIILYTIIRMFFSLKWNKTLVISLFVLWIASWGVSAYIFSTNIYNYNQSTSTTNKKQHTITSDTLTVKPIGNLHSNGFEWKTGVLTDRIRFEISENDDIAKNNVKVTVKRRSKGKNIDDATENCNNIDFNYTITDNTISFPTALIYKADGAKYRGQSISLYIEVAPGTSIIMPEQYYYRNSNNIFDQEEIETSINDNDIHIRSIKELNTPKTEEVSDTTTTKSEVRNNPKDDGKDEVKKETIYIKNGNVITK